MMLIQTAVDAVLRDFPRVFSWKPPSFESVSVTKMQGIQGLAGPGPDRVREMARKAAVSITRKQEDQKAITCRLRATTPMDFFSESCISVEFTRARIALTPSETWYLNVIHAAA